MPILRTLGKKLLEKIVVNRENAGNQLFSLFTTMFSMLPDTNFLVLLSLIVSRANVFNPLPQNTAF